MDAGMILTERQLASLESRIHDVYDEAANDLQRTASSYFSEFFDRDAAMRSRVDSGEITNKAYKDWQTAQMGRGMRFEQMSTKMAERATNANIVANDYVNKSMANIYALNYNYGTYMIRDYSEGINFALLDESTVNRLLTDNPQLMPNYPEQRAVNRGIDLAYGQQQISNAVTSGILRGTSVQDMARDLTSRVDTMSRSSALRAARTAVTSAQNGGRQDMLNNAIEMGIKAEKMWIATEDDRTRESHFELNGVQVSADDEFPNGLMFPGDPSGDPGEIYNCRCTLGYVLPETKKDFTDGGKYDTGNTVESYNEWLQDQWAKQSAGGWGGFDSGTSTGVSQNAAFGGVITDQEAAKKYDEALSEANPDVDPNKAVEDSYCDMSSGYVTWAENADPLTKLHELAHYEDGRMMYDADGKRKTSGGVTVEKYNPFKKDYIERNDGYGFSDVLGAERGVNTWSWETGFYSEEKKSAVDFLTGKSYDGTDILLGTGRFRDGLLEAGYSERSVDTLLDMFSSLTDGSATGGEFCALGGHPTSYWKTLDGAFSSSTTREWEDWANYCALRSTGQQDLLDIYASVAPTSSSILSDLYDTWTGKSSTYRCRYM